jgi:hypothetical protein
MKRNMKGLGLATVIAVALSAAGVSAASAHFTSSSDWTTSTATALNTQVLKNTGTPGENSEASCTAVGVTGGPFGTDETELTVHPEYGGTCTISIEGLGAPMTAEIITTGCNVVFTTTATNNVHLECEVGKQMEVTAFILGKFRKCLDVHAQTPTTALVDYHNGTDAATGKMDVEVVSTIEGITYEKTGSCAFGVTEGNDMKYEGNITVTGDEVNTNNPVDITKS